MPRATLGLMFITIETSISRIQKLRSRLTVIYNVLTQT